MRGSPGGGKRLVVFAALSCVVGCSLLTSLDGYTGGGAADAAITGADGGPAATKDAPVGLPDVVAPDGGTAYVAAVLADSPIAYYPLEETSGSTAKDVVGGKDATFAGKVGRGVPGAIGFGAAFDGSSTRLEMPVGQFAFPGRAPWTIEVWVNPTTVDGQVRRVADYGVAGGTGGYTIDFANVAADSNWTGMARQDADGGSDGYAQAPVWEAGKLHHLVATYDGSLTQVWIDGKASPTANGLLDQPALPEGRLVFGDLNTPTFFKLDGMIDEIAIYDRALEATRVLAHYNARGN